MTRHVAKEKKKMSMIDVRARRKYETTKGMQASEK